MAIRVAINGFGRIGRLAFRSILESGRTDVEVVGINDLAPVEINAHLLKYDSVHGVLKNDVKASGSDIIVDGKTVKCFSERNPADLGWGGLNVDVVYECTGLFLSKEKAGGHLKAGAKKVLISAPSKAGKGESTADLTVVYGVNDSDLKSDMTIVSNASCTTNCLAPVAKILDEEFGIVRGFMTTIHAYTGDQNIVDSYHPDPRRARAGALSMIPTTTGAAIAVAKVLPKLEGKLDGVAVRVPTPNVSLVDLTFEAGKDVTVDQINSAIKKAADSKVLKNALGYFDGPFVSIDFNHSSFTSNFDATGTKVMDGNFVRIASWYDNEWGFSCRMTDTAVAMFNC